MTLEALPDTVWQVLKGAGGLLGVLVLGKGKWVGEETMLRRQVGRLVDWGCLCAMGAIC